MPGVANEQRQDFEFPRRQFDRLATAHDAVVEDIYQQVSAMVDCFLATRLEATAKRQANARKQLARAEGLFQIVVRA